MPTLIENLVFLWYELVSPPLCLCLIHKFWSWYAVEMRHTLAAVWPCHMCNWGSFCFKAAKCQSVLFWCSWGEEYKNYLKLFWLLNSYQSKCTNSSKCDCSRKLYFDPPCLSSVAMWHNMAALATDTSNKCQLLNYVWCVSMQLLCDGFCKTHNSRFFRCQNQ